MEHNNINTKEVLMLGYMNNEAFNKTIEGPNVWFYSRSRQKLWEKGETSGNHLIVKNITTDCDKDTLLVQVEPIGPSCHKGEKSCFHESELKDLTWQNSDIFSATNSANLFLKSEKLLPLNSLIEFSKL